MDYDKFFREENIKEYRSVPFWSWNDKLEPEELRKQIRWMKEQGFGGYFMHARDGLLTEYLGKEWFECVKACLDEGEKQGMDSWAYDENGFPSGFVGGKLLEDKENCDRYLTYKIGDFDKNATVSYDVSGEDLKRAFIGENGKEYLNVYEGVSVSTADVLNPEVVDKFIVETHEKYKKALSDGFKKLKGFFTDEPQYYRAQHPFTKVLVKIFKDEYGEDIYDKLGLLFVEKKGYRDFRYRYWKNMQKLLVGFSEKIYDWCHKNGVEFTGHYVEERDLNWQMLCCAGVMSNYMYEDIPGVDHLGRGLKNPVTPKQVSSVAEQQGKKKVLTETFACCGWDVTPKELKRITEWQYVNGVNLMCQHLLPYSEYGQRKRDYPAHFSRANPWVAKNFKAFNDYFAKLGCLLGESKQCVNVAYFSPVRSMYFDYKRKEFTAKNSVNDSYLENAEKLCSMNVCYHILDETVMEKLAKVEKNTLKVGECSYDYVVFPKTLTMDKNTAEIFETYYKNGGKMLFLDGIPDYLESEKHNYDFSSNVTLKEIVEAQPYFIDDYETEIRSVLREINGEKYIYAVNLSADKEYSVKFGGDFKSFERINLEDNNLKSSAKIVSTKVTLAPCESAVLFLSEKEPEKTVERKTLTLSAPYVVSDATDNYLLIDCFSYSYDGKNYGEKMHYSEIFDKLLNERYNGELYLKLTFNVKELPERIAFLSEDMHNISCVANGNDVVFNGTSDFEKKIYKADISKFVKLGENEIVLKINFYESEKVYYTLFGENITESLKNCLAYDTSIEQFYLQGDFGVYSEKGFVDGNEKNVYLAEDFYIAKRKTVITDAVKDGYPFFAGSMTLKTTFYSDGLPAILSLNGRYGLSYLKINGRSVEKSYFDYCADITDYVRKGENDAEITLYSGNRNLLGPHHCPTAEEPLGVGPWSFGAMEVSGGKKTLRKNYSFVKFGLFE